MNYYNDNDSFAALWLEELIKAGELPGGSVDARSVIEVVPGDLGSFRQCHFFAGIGGWARALELAGWPEDREIWTASLPCQPLSVAGARQGALDGRHLWPAFYRLVEVCRPAIIFGEQVASADGREWLAGVRADLEDAGYACGAAVMPASAVGAPHRRERLYWCAVEHASGERVQQRSAEGFGAAPSSQGEVGQRQWSGGYTESSGQIGGMADTGQLSARRAAECGEAQGGRPSGDVAGSGGERVADAESERSGWRQDNEDRGRGQCASADCGERGMPERADKQTAWPGSVGSFWDDAEWRIGADGKARRVVADLRGLVDGLSESLGRLCIDYFKEAMIPIMGYAETTKSRSDQVLRAVWDQVASEEIWQEPRGFFGIQEKEILWFYLLELARRFDGIWVSGTIEETSRSGMRSLWLHGRSSCPSQGWGRDEQRPVEHTDALRLLSQFLARHARQAFEAVRRSNAATLPLLVTNAPNRVGRLRGYGNAIVPQVAAKFIIAMMEVLNIGMTP